ncbi:MAG TPA: ABATE domain-containing protein, partial [Stellaceae bacterium]|nr:ABATE domain-containing protein [Stellaceae bacterium]
MSQPTGMGTTTDLVPAFSDELCLDFANTRYWRGIEAPMESLSGIGDVVAWCKSAGLISASAADSAGHWWEEHPDRATAAFREAIALREALYEVFRASADGNEPQPAALLALNAALAQAPGRLGIERQGDRFAWRVPHATEPTVAAMLAPVVWSGTELLLGSRLTRVRHCANDR